MELAWIVRARFSSVTILSLSAVMVVRLSIYFTMSFSMVSMEPARLDISEYLLICPSGSARVFSVAKRVASSEILRIGRTNCFLRYRAASSAAAAAISTVMIPTVIR